MIAEPVRYTPDLEQPMEGEGETREKIDQDLHAVLETTYEHSGHAIRSVHAKAHAIVEGTLTVMDGLPPELAQGLFAAAGEHRTILRFSTNAGDFLDDSIPLPRGLSIKVHDVPGARLPDAAGTAQDMLFLNAPAFPAPDAAAFERSLGLLAKTTDRVEWLKKVAAYSFQKINQAREAVGMDPSPSLVLMGGMPNVEPLGETFYSTVPFRYGDYVAKFSLKPVAPWMTALTGETIDADDRPDALREDVSREFAADDAEWAFRVQLLRDPEHQPVEDASVEWPEDVSPWQTVGRLTVAAQDGWDDARVRQVNEHLRFSPWTGLEAHRPLGAINRARKDSYENSARYRETKNGCPIYEPGIAA